MPAMLHVFENIGALGYTLNALGFFVLSLLLLFGWKRQFLGGLLLAACLCQMLWSAILLFQLYTNKLPGVALLLTEEIRLLIWVVFLLEILRSAAGESIRGKLFFAYGFLASLFTLTLVYGAVANTWFTNISQAYSYVFDLILATFGLILTEQIYRNSKHERRWSIKYLCMGLGLLFVYELYMFSHAILFDGMNQALWNARGYVNLVLVPLLAISAARNPKWSFSIFVSRHVVFYSSSLFAVGGYLTVMAIGGYYIQFYGGGWGREMQIIFFVGAIVVLMVVMLSGALRAKIKIFLNKHFYENKYDYREEWIGFTQRMSQIESPRYLKEQILQTVAMLMHSSGAILYLQDEDAYKCVAAWNAEKQEGTIESKLSFIEYLRNRENIINIKEHGDVARDWGELDIPGQIKNERAWLIIPLKHYYDLIGFIILLEPFVNVEVNWEDRDLLLAIGKQVSSYLAFMIASETLAETEKFAAFNRLSAYVVHDMKNTVAQLDLIVKNAEKHKSNPEFIADTFLTVSNVVDRMKRMLSQLKRIDANRTDFTYVDINELLKVVAKKHTDKDISIHYELCQGPATVYLEADRLLNVIEHLVTNAKEAITDSGQIYLRSEIHEHDLIIEVEDTGAGMSVDFVNNHLFKPFETTKGNAGMGVGVFEAREFVKYCGGKLSVQSTQGVGTIFRIILPLAERENNIEFKHG